LRPGWKKCGAGSAVGRVRASIRARPWRRRFCRSGEPVWYVAAVAVVVVRLLEAHSGRSQHGSSFIEVGPTQLPDHNECCLRLAPGTAPWWMGPPAVWMVIRFLPAAAAAAAAQHLGSLAGWPVRASSDGSLACLRRSTGVGHSDGWCGARPNLNSPTRRRVAAPPHSTCRKTECCVRLLANANQAPCEIISLKYYVIRATWVKGLHSLEQKCFVEVKMLNIGFMVSLPQTLRWWGLNKSYTLHVTIIRLVRFKRIFKWIVFYLKVYFFTESTSRFKPLLW
jgi:hypothetical protein